MVPKASPAVGFTMHGTVIGAASVAGCGVGTDGIGTDRSEAIAVGRLAVETRDQLGRERPNSVNFSNE